MVMTRAALFGTAAAFFVSFMLQSYRWSIRKIIFTGLILLLISGIVISQSKGMTIRMLKLAMTIPALNDSNYIREKLYSYGMHEGHMLGIWDDPHFARFGPSFQLLSESPIFGVGWKKQYQVNEHNWYIQQIVIYGIVTFILILVFFSSLVFRMWRVLRMELRRDSPDAGFGILVFACVIGSLVYLNASPGENMQFWVIFGLGSAWARNTYERQQRYRKSCNGSLRGVIQHRPKFVLPHHPPGPNLP